MKDQIPIHSDIFRIPLFVPCLAIVLNITVITFLPVKDLISAAIFIGIGLMICWLADKVPSLLK